MCARVERETNDPLFPYGRYDIEPEEKKTAEESPDIFSAYFAIFDGGDRQDSRLITRTLGADWLLRARVVLRATGEDKTATTDGRWQNGEANRKS